LTPD
jgi:dynein heavy chain